MPEEASREICPFLAVFCPMELFFRDFRRFVSSCPRRDPRFSLVYLLEETTILSRAAEERDEEARGGEAG